MVFIFNFKFNNKKNIITENEFIKREIDEFLKSKSREIMIVGEKYYKLENDIINKIKFCDRGRGKEVDTDRANFKLLHADYKNLVDDKVNYLLGKDYTIKGDLEEVSLLNGVLKDFTNTLRNLAYESSNKGIAWLHIYLDENGEFNTVVIPSEQIKPLWKDTNHTILEGVIRVYDIVEYNGKDRGTVTKVEYWTGDSVSFYKQEGNEIIVDSEKYLDTKGQEIGHFKENGVASYWGIVPFIPFKNNWTETPDIKSVKSLIDALDIATSDIADYIAEVQNFIYILKGYGGEDLGEFLHELKRYRAVKIDDSEGGLDTLNPKIDITPMREHIEQLKKDILESGQGVNKKVVDSMGTAPSGIALKFLYSGLDLKCNGLENEFKRGFKILIEFLRMYFAKKNGIVIQEDFEIIFNRKTIINEKELIEQCKSSLGIISNKTILANHPWIKDVEEELKALEEQERQENSFLKDIVPIEEGLEDEE